MEHWWNDNWGDKSEVIVKNLSGTILPQIPGELVRESNRDLHVISVCIWKRNLVLLWRRRNWLVTCDDRRAGVQSCVLFIIWLNTMLVHQNSEVLGYGKYTSQTQLNFINTFTAIVDLSRFNNSCLKSPASTLVDLNFNRARSALSA